MVSSHRNPDLQRSTYLMACRNKFNSEKVLDVTYASKSRLFLTPSAYNLWSNTPPQIFKASTNSSRSSAIVLSWTKTPPTGQRYWACPMPHHAVYLTLLIISYSIRPVPGSVSLTLNSFKYGLILTSGIRLGTEMEFPAANNILKKCRSVSAAQQIGKEGSIPGDLSLCLTI